MLVNVSVVFNELHKPETFGLVPSLLRKQTVTHTLGVVCGKNLVLDNDVTDTCSCNKNFGAHSMILPSVIYT